MELSRIAARIVNALENVEWSEVKRLCIQMRALAASLVHSADSENTGEVTADLEAIKDIFEAIEAKIAYIIPDFDAN